MSAGSVSVSAVSASALPDMIALLRAIEAERLPDDPGAPGRAEAEVRHSLACFDFTQSGSSRMLLASLERVPAGRESQDPCTAAGTMGSHVPAGRESQGPRRAAGTTGSRVPAGYVLVVRIPKPDARVGFLFVEELYVLHAYRRSGVAGALLRGCESVAREWRLHGIRLLVRPENEAARALYRRAGYAESQTYFCERILD